MAEQNLHSTVGFSEESEFLEDEDMDAAKSPWKENHGSFLIAFASGILVFGSGILACRQMQFRPPRFPDARVFPAPEDTAVQPRSDPATFSAIARGAESSEGMMRFAVYESESTFNQSEKALIKEAIAIEGDSATWTVDRTRLPDRFAVAAYHDANGNGKLDRGPLGIPAERYGFSNDARGLTGPPSFDDAVVVLGDQIDPLGISIR